MKPERQRQLVRVVGAAVVTAVVTELLRNVASPSALAIVGPVVMLIAHQLLDDLADQLIGAVTGVTA